MFSQDSGDCDKCTSPHFHDNTGDNSIEGHLAVRTENLLLNHKTFITDRNRLGLNFQTLPKEALLAEIYVDIYNHGPENVIRGARLQPTKSIIIQTPALQIFHCLDIVEMAKLISMLLSNFYLYFGYHAIL